MTPKRRRLYTVLLILLGVCLTTGLILRACQDNIVFYLKPSEIAAKSMPPGTRFRLGGFVAAGSVQRTGAMVSFAVTDFEQNITVRYKGLLPDLFKEGQGVVTEGRLGPDGVFQADEVLAKHDENYMPPELKDDLKKSDAWVDKQGGGHGQPPGSHATDGTDGR